MVVQRFILLVVLAAGCTFDSSTPLVGGVSPDAAGVSGCDNFVTEPCGECGVFACAATPAGAVIDCVEDAVCEPDSSATDCQDGDLRPCGECAEQLCVGGQWVPDCVPRHDRCQTGEYCLAESGASYSCGASCSTLGVGGSCSTPGNAPIPDFVPVGTVWKLGGACDEDEACTDCICTSDFSGVPYVDCYYACD